MFVVLCSGALAGFVLFAIQHFTIVPLIEAAERYEHADHDATEWKPADGWERTGWTVVTSVLTGIGFAAVLFGFLSLTGRTITMRQGVLWGLAAFACFHLAPALGLPPLPPGVPVSDVQPRQLWWLWAVLSTAAGLWLLTGQTWTRRIAGALVIAVPHLIGAPAGAGDNAVPAGLMRNFVIASLSSAAIFWTLLGGIGGFLAAQSETATPRTACDRPAV
jgi:cobalt transporter subunit CbtA